MKILTGKVVLPVSADIVRAPLTPRFTAPTTNTPVALVPGIFTMPSPVRVLDKATMSRVGPAAAENKKVLSPGTIGAGSVFKQSKLNCNSVGAIGAVGVSTRTKLWAAPGGMFTGALGVLVTCWVAGSVV